MISGETSGVQYISKFTLCKKWYCFVLYRYKELIYNCGWHVEDYSRKFDSTKIKKKVDNRIEIAECKQENSSVK